MDNTDKRIAIQTLAESYGWQLICEAIDKNINRLSILIEDDSPWCEENDKILYSWRVLNIKQKKMLQKLKELPKQLVEDYKWQIPTNETLEEMLKNY